MGWQIAPRYRPASAEAPCIATLITGKAPRFSGQPGSAFARRFTHAPGSAPLSAARATAIPIPNLAGFNALFATTSIEAAKSYDLEFAAQQSTFPEAQRLKVGLIDSFAAHEDDKGGLLGERYLKKKGAADLPIAASFLSPRLWLDPGVTVAAQDCAGDYSRRISKRSALPMVPGSGRHQVTAVVIPPRAPSFLPHVGQRQEKTARRKKLSRHRERGGGGQHPMGRSGGKERMNALPAGSLNLDLWSEPCP